MEGQRVGRYRLVRRLGAGGFGEVWEAEVDRPSGPQRVALKRMRGGGEALRREARVAALLRHRHLVDVYEVGDDGDEAFCAMELCALGSLAEHAPLSPRAVVEVGLAVCAALRFAHEELGLVHLDLKPENLLLAADGTPKVADLGLARAAGTLDRRRTGTARFMAPEQRAGATVDARTDVFGLGRTLEALATGWAPSGVATFDPDATGDGAGAFGSVPGWLRDLVSRATAPEPAERHPSLGALAEELGRLPVEGDRLADLPGVRPPDARTGPRAPRAALVARVRSALAAPGLRTLTGPAGVGKSTVAELAADGLPDEAVWVAARGIGGPGALLDAVGAELGLAGGPGLAARVDAALAARRAVLVLDDADRLPADVGALVAGWAARLAVLVTARAPTGWPGEACTAVPPLDVAAGVDLLRALAGERGVRLRPEDPRAPALVEHLGGNPLAISLAAGRLGVIALDELSPTARWLRGGAEVDHASFAQALDEDWALLGPSDREALASLTVFEGTFDDADAAAVVDDPTAIPRLAARGLVSATRDGRWRLPEVVAAYAAPRRAGSAEERHTAWFARPGPALDRPEVVRAERRRRPEVLAAARRALARGDARAVVAATLRLAAWLRFGGDPAELAALAAGAAARVGAGSASPEDDPVRADLAWLEALLARESADAEPALERALAAAGDDPRLRSRILVSRANRALVAGRLDLAVADAREAGRLAAVTGDARMDRMARGTLLLALEGEDPEAAAAGYGALGREAEAAEDLALALRVWSNSANLELRAGRLDAAEALFHRALELARAVGDPSGTALVTGNLGVVAGLRRDPDAAAGWYLAAEWASARAGQPAQVAWWRVQRLRGDPGHPSAVADAEAAARTLAAAGHGFGETSARVLLALALARLGRSADADAALAQADEVAARVGPRARARVRHAEAELREGRGDIARARTAWREAIGFAEAAADVPMARHSWVALASSPGPWDPAERAAVRAGLAAVALGEGTGTVARALAALDGA